ncbi:MAG: 50S ribosomal protein L3 [Clostridia bacterium]|nr:50S ribosomal protein L3 [Clostridia bacterium]
MNKAIVGKKLGMSQVFAQDGQVIPVTIIEAGPCPVVHIKTMEKDGYEALQVAFSETTKKPSQPVAGVFAKAKVPVSRYLKELKLPIAGAEVGKTVLTVAQFAEGDKVDVSGVSKGHGFSGVIKRWNAQRVGSMSHGTGPIHRSVGSMAANSDPSRVFKNKHMAGQYGNENVTVQNLEVVKVDADRNLLFVKGGVPGPKGGLLILRDSVKA